jgi:hypothetical protein
VAAFVAQARQSGRKAEMHGFDFAIVFAAAPTGTQRLVLAYADRLRITRSAAFNIVSLRSLEEQG